MLFVSLAKPTKNAKPELKHRSCAQVVNSVERVPERDSLHAMGV